MSREPQRLVRLVPKDSDVPPEKKGGAKLPPEGKSAQPLVSPTRPPRWPWIVGLGVLTGLAILLLGFFLWRRSAGSLLSGQPLSEINSQPTPSPEPVEPSFTVALVGYGGPGHDGASLTDTILVARFLLEQKRVVVLSVPRDLWVQAPDEAGQLQNIKINAVYALHGPEALKQSLAQVTGWQVDRFFGVDFRGFTQAIDTLGGVEVNIERTFNDYEYPIPGRERLICEEMKDENDNVIATPEPVPDDGITSVMDEIEEGEVDREALPENVKNYPCRYEHVQFEAGRQTLVGEQALKYARSRHAPEDGNDFNRARRQQNLIQSLVLQVFKVNFISKVPGLISNLRANTATDLSALELAEWLARAPEVRSWPTTNLILTDHNYLQQGQSADRQFILRPHQGDFQWDQIKNWLASTTIPTRSLSAPVVEIQAGPTEQQAANTLEAAIASHSAWPILRVSGPSTRSASASAVIQVLVPQIDEQALEWLQSQLQASLDSSKISSDAAQFNGPHLRVLWR